MFPQSIGQLRGKCEVSGSIVSGEKLASHQENKGWQLRGKQHKHEVVVVGCKTAWVKVLFDPAYTI